jgi:hypothetical protein
MYLANVLIYDLLCSVAIKVHVTSFMSEHVIQHQTTGKEKARQ